MRCANNQMTLGEMIATLKRKDPDKQITFGFGYSRPTGVDSYRGYYEDLAIGYQSCAECTVEKLLKMLESVHGKTLTGYKGGDYLMDDDTVVWAANYGLSGGMAIVDIVDMRYEIWIKTELVD